jgi:hypothetical protein
MPALLAALPALLVVLLRAWLVSLIGRVLLTVGVGLFAYNVGVPELLSWIGGKFTALPDFIRASAGRMGIDVFVTMILSAMAVRATAKVFFGKSAE